VSSLVGTGWLLLFLVVGAVFWWRSRPDKAVG